MKKLIFFTLTVLIITQEAVAQVNIKYGINLGLAYSKQLWDSNYGYILSKEKDYKSGFSISFVSEFEINNFLGFRIGLGYLQKGFKEKSFELTSQRTFYVDLDEDLTTHNLGLDLAIKIGDLNSKWSPYMLIGLRCDFLLGYEDVVVNDPEYIYEVLYSFSPVFDNYNIPCIGAIIGAGMEFKDLYYLEVEYNPSILPSYDSNDYIVKDKYFALKLGLNINKLFQKDK